PRRVFLARAVKALDGAAIVGTVDPDVAGAKLKAGEVRLLFDCIQGGEQNSGVDAVAHGFSECGHLKKRDSSCMQCWGVISIGGALVQAVGVASRNSSRSVRCDASNPASSDQTALGMPAMENGVAATTKATVAPNRRRPPKPLRMASWNDGRIARPASA